MLLPEREPEKKLEEKNEVHEKEVVNDVEATSRIDTADVEQEPHGDSVFIEVLPFDRYPSLASGRRATRYLQFDTAVVIVVCSNHPRSRRVQLFAELIPPIELMMT